MPLLLDTLSVSDNADLRASNCVTVAVVNNMPDAALEATERQFTDLLRAASSRVIVRLQQFSIPEVPRSNTVQREMSERYRDISRLWDSHIDGLIVTGAEPKAKNLKDEPFWNTLSQLVEWAGNNTTSTIWSCLAAHAAVLHADGVERLPASEKITGIFECETVALHPMTIDSARGLRVPHSRYNGLPEKALVDSGYRVLTRAGNVGVDMFARQEKSFHLFLQGHPEYEARTLLREYRRDVSRYLKGEREDYPVLPQSYFDKVSTEIALEFRERALVNRAPELVSSFPMEGLGEGLGSPWQPCAVSIYEKWFEYLSGRKSDRRPLAGPLRRAFRDWPTSGVVASGMRTTR
jgi:homoserine O-succinyltransferase/O-acetyltransferase